MLRPRIFDLTLELDYKEFTDLMAQGVVTRVDTYQQQLRELHAIENPALRGDALKISFEAHHKARSSGSAEERQGKWVYFPWIATVVHLLDEEEYFLVRTARNRELITLAEQKTYYNGVVGVGGLSIGNSAALAIVLSGGAGHIKIADFDTLDLSNLNRIRAGVDALGLAKVEITARQIYLLNPYAEVEIFSNGLTEETIREFFKDLDVMVDELDSLPIKYLVREEARKHKIPVVMAADCDESGIIDVERYDLDPQTEFFHGRLGDISYDELLGLDKKATGSLIARQVGIENHNERMLQSLESLGKTIVSWPQLGPTALLNSAAIAYCVRQLLLNKPLINGRAIVSLEERLDPTYTDESSVAARVAVVEKFRKILGVS